MRRAVCALTRRSASERGREAASVKAEPTLACLPSLPRGSSSDYEGREIRRRHGGMFLLFHNRQHVEATVRSILIPLNEAYDHEFQVNSPFS